MDTFHIYIYLIIISNSYKTFSNMKLHWNDHAIHALSIRSSEVRCVIPRLIYPDCLHSLTTLSFPDLSVAMAADANVSLALNFLSPLAKSGCNVSCFPALYATSTHLPKTKWL